MKTLSLLLLLALPASAAESLRFGRFGLVPYYRDTPHPPHVVLFLSGDGDSNGGFDAGFTALAKAFASLDVLVVGVDTPRYLKALGRGAERCSYPAGDLEALSQLIQKKLDYPTYVQPVLVGYSSGATLAYAALAQAPANTFRGAVSMGFCSDLPVKKPLCRGVGLQWKQGPGGKGVDFLPAAHLESPWIVLQGANDETCVPAKAQTFVEQVSLAKIVLAPKVGHGFSVQKNWLPQFKTALEQLLSPPKGSEPVAPGEVDAGHPMTDVSDLPLVEVHPPAASASAFVVILSGDGGWAGIDRSVAAAFAARGYEVVGLDSLKYFWVKKSPEQGAKDLERVLRHYSDKWKLDRVVLVGYSRGADVLPALASRLPKEWQDKVQVLAFLGLGQRTSFEFHLSEWLGSGGDDSPVLPEVKKLRGRPMLCLYGEEETDSLCASLEKGLARSVKLKGGHHFDGDYENLANLIIGTILADAGVSQ